MLGRVFGLGPDYYHLAGGKNQNRVGFKSHKYARETFWIELYFFYIALLP